MTDRQPAEVTNLDRYGNPVLPWSRANDLLASGPKGPPGFTRPDQGVVVTLTTVAGRTRPDQPWRVFQRGFRLFTTNTLRPRRTTTDPLFCFNALSEFLAFNVCHPFGSSGQISRLLERQPFSFSQNSSQTKTRVICATAANGTGTCRSRGRSRP